MSEHDAFEEEMDFLARIREEDAELLLAGLGPQPGDGADLEEVASFVSAMRAAVPTGPDRGAEASLVPRLAGTARSATDRATGAPTATLAATDAAREPAWRPRLALAAKVAVALALLPAAMAGLAFAGVTLPEPAREAMERLGLDLPNQSAVEEDFSATDDEDADRDDGQRPRDRGGTPSTRPSHAAGRGKSANRARSNGPRRVARGHGRGEGEPQLGEPAPIVPPGQGGVPPGQGGDSPAQGGGGPSGADAQATVPPGGVPPGQAQKP